MITVLFIDVVVVVSLILASRRRVEAALPLFCFYLVLMPHESRIVIPGLFDFSTDRVAILTLLILFLVRRERITRAPIPLKRLICFHVVCALCSSVYSLSVATSAKLLVGQVIEYYLLYYMLVRITSEIHTIYKMLYSMLVAIGICCLFGLLEAYASWSILAIFPSNLWVTYGPTGLLYIEWGRGLRIRSTFPHPILFGDALAMSIPLVLYLLSVWKHRLQRFVMWTVLLLMFWALYKTSSRGPWIVAVVSCILLFLMIANHVRKYLIVMATVSLIVLCARPGIWQTVVELYRSTLDESSVVGSSYQYRHVVADTVRQAVAKEPGRAMLGYGLGTFRELGLEIDFLNQRQRWYTCDNNWALFLYETGYLGLLSIGMLLFKPLLMMIQSYKRARGAGQNLVCVLFISVAGFYFSLLSVAGYDWGQQGFMAWILISLSVVYPRVSCHKGTRARPSMVPIQSPVMQGQPSLSTL
jgi:hypothetical protein